jgi:hypothetical protein
MTDEQPPLDPGAAPGEVPATPPVEPPVAPPVAPPVEGSGWVQPPPAAAPPQVQGSGWVQPAPGPNWGTPSVPVEGSGWVQPPAAPAAAPGPAWGQPPAAPPPMPPAAPAGWAQPQPTSGWVQPAAGAKGPVTFLARIAGLGLVIVGLVWVAFGLIAVVGGAWIQSLINQIAPGNTDTGALAAGGSAIATGLAAIGIVWIVLAVIEVLAGLGAMLGKGFGRVIGIVYSLLFGLVLLPGISAVARAPLNTDVSGSDVDVRPFFLFFVVMFVIYVYSLIVLLFRWRGPSRA